jgi:hypothetical protein
MEENPTVIEEHLLTLNAAGMLVNLHDRHINPAYEQHLQEVINGGGSQEEQRIYQRVKEIEVTMQNHVSKCRRWGHAQIIEEERWFAAQGLPVAQWLDKETHLFRRPQ